MDYPPSQEVLTSLPLLPVIVALLLLGLLVAACGWLLARRRRPTAPPFAPADIPWLPALLEPLPCGALLADAEGRVTLANAQARLWLGEAGRSFKLPRSIQALVRRVAASGVSEGLETRAPLGGDHRVWVEAAALGGNGGVLVLVEQREGGGVTAEVYRPLMHTIAHELRTPLTAIMGHAEILDSCSIEEETLWRRSQQFITREVKRLARLVEDLLTLSRLDLSASPLVPLSLQAAAEEALSALWEPAEEKGITLTLQAAPGLPRVLGDADRLRQVFINLLDNAVKYTPSGGRVTVRLAPDENGDRVQTEVSDTGMGIPRADLPHVFDPLFRGERASRAATGTGLGLTIVRTILAQYGAEIRVQSDPERGTTFFFALPVAA
jgi:signal transduction histidine kinase